MFCLNKNKHQNDTNVIIVIPVYKSSLDDFEEKSFRQCLNILFKRDIVIVTHTTVDLNIYLQIAIEKNVHLNIEYFEKSFFQDIKGYNRLMMNLDFYKRFKTYSYMLIYQLDAYIFKDELDFWCNKPYDYIGAPWFEHFSSHENGAKLWKIGNGGFSLRKIAWFIKVLSWKLPVKKITYKQLIGHKKFQDILRYILYMLGRYNTMRYYLKINGMNEDVFYCIFLSDSWISPVLPTIQEGMKFAFEKSPAYLMTISNQQLPMGCHAFQKYEYDSFWIKFINKDIV